jgi:hypothetical protein
MSQLPYHKVCHDPWCQFIFNLLRDLFSLVTDGQMYYGYCINCLYPVMGEA